MEHRTGQNVELHTEATQGEHQYTHSQPTVNLIFVYSYIGAQFTAQGTLFAGETLPADGKKTREETSTETETFRVT